jgi:type IV secretory pathway VirB2 component (pilin)
VSFVDWALAVHVLSAFAYVGGLVLFWVLIVAVRRVDTPEETLRMEPIVKVGNVAVGVGVIGTIVIGIYLAFAVDSYAIWDGWIIAAIVLWAVAGGLGQRTGVAYMQGMNKAKELDAAGKTGPDQELLALNRTQTGLILQTLASLAVLLILVDMIFKPGA